MNFIGNIANNCILFDLELDWSSWSWSWSSSSEDLRPATLFHKDTAVHSQTPVTRNPTSHSGRLRLGSVLTIVVV